MADDDEVLHDDIARELGTSAREASSVYGAFAGFDYGRAAEHLRRIAPLPRAVRRPVTPLRLFGPGGQTGR